MDDKSLVSYLVRLQIWKFKRMSANEVHRLWDSKGAAPSQRLSHDINRQEELYKDFTEKASECERDSNSGRTRGQSTIVACRRSSAHTAAGGLAKNRVI